VIQQATTGSASGSTSGRPAFSWRLIIKDCLYFVALAILLGGLLNYSLLASSFKGTLVARIQQNQLANLKTTSNQLYPGIAFLDMASAKKLFDDRIAIFIDARTPQEYEVGHISGAISLPVKELLTGVIVPSTILPNKDSVLIAYCDGGGCDYSLEVARQLSTRGYHNIFVLEDGYPGWEAAGYVVVKK
jgi:rhodanese-related sulfurtransferase